MKGTVFDIRRFSTHDGDGLRTTVFMKGCPLQCIWCQNPEGIEPGIYPIYFENQCIHCGTCLRQCKQGGAEERDGRLRINRYRKENWEQIAENCPAEAIRMDAKQYDIDKLVTEIKKDNVFFDHGGGVTFSGGEPLMQSKFVGAVLQKLKEDKIHTAIETSLAASDQALADVLPYTDQIFADMKIFNEESHKRLVGSSNVQIKRNLEMLLTSFYKDRVIIRTPLIPEYTAAEENLGAIAEFLSEKYPDVHYELLNYNPLAEVKYHLVNRSYCFRNNPKLYTKEQMLQFGKIAKAHGIKNLILEL